MSKSKKNQYHHSNNNDDGYYYNNPTYIKYKQKIHDLSDRREFQTVLLEKMRNRVVFAIGEVEKGRWTKFQTYDKETEAHDFLGLFTHTRTFNLDREENECLWLVYRVLLKTGFKMRRPEYAYESGKGPDLYDIKKGLEAWNDYGATEDKILRILDTCKVLLENELKNRNVVFA